MAYCKYSILRNTYTISDILRRNAFNMAYWIICYYSLHAHYRPAHCAAQETS